MKLLSLSLSLFFWVVLRALVKLLQRSFVCKCMALLWLQLPLFGTEWMSSSSMAGSGSIIQLQCAIEP